MSDTPDRCGTTERDDPSGAGVNKGKNMNADAYNKRHCSNNWALWIE